MTSRPIHTLAAACFVAALAPAQKQQEAIIIEQHEARQQAEKVAAEAQAERSDKIRAKLLEVVERLAKRDQSAEERAEATRQLLGLVEKIEAGAKMRGDRFGKGSGTGKKKGPRRGVFVVGEDGLPSKLEWIEKKGGKDDEKVFGVVRDPGHPFVIESHGDVARLKATKRKLEQGHAKLRKLEHHIKRQHEEIAEQKRHLAEPHRKLEVEQQRRDLGARARDLRARIRGGEAHEPESEMHWMEAKKGLAEAKAAFEHAKRAMKAHRVSPEHEDSFEIHFEARTGSDKAVKADKGGKRLRLGGEDGALLEIGPGGKGFVLRKDGEEIVIGKGGTIVRGGKVGALRLLHEAEEHEAHERESHEHEVHEHEVEEIVEHEHEQALEIQLDSELRSMIDQLRGEMRELREMVRDIRNQLRSGDRRIDRRGTPARVGGRRTSAMRPSGPRRDRAPR